MEMDGDLRVFRDYLAFTVPHITMFAGAVFGILLLLGIDPPLAAGIFAILYGGMLTISGLVIRPHLSGVKAYSAYMIFATLLFAAGIIIVLEWAF